MILSMTNQHTDSDSALTVRVPAEVLAAGKSAVAERHLQMRGFVSACLSALAADPDTFLHALEGHWPPEKTRGNRAG